MWLVSKEIMIKMSDIKLKEIFIYNINKKRNHIYGGWKMDRGMEWLIGGILALIIAIVGFYYTKKVTAVIVPIIFIFYGLYKVVLGKK